MRRTISEAQQEPVQGESTAATASAPPTKKAEKVEVHQPVRTTGRGSERSGRSLASYRDPWEYFFGPGTFFGPRGFFPDFMRQPGRVFRDLEEGLENLVPSISSVSPKWTPHVDVIENKNEYVITAELPGVVKENVKIDIKDDLLTLRGERQDTFSKKDEHNQEIHRERFYGSFSRSFTLPENTDPKNIRASFKDGILELTIPKKEATEENVIEVKID